MRGSDLIGPWIGKLTHLRYLGQSQGAFEDGTIPAEIGDIAALTELDFSDMGLTGTIPPELAKLPVDKTFCGTPDF